MSNEDKEHLIVLMKEMEDWLYSGDEQIYDKATLEAKGKNLNDAGTKLYNRFNNWERLNQSLSESESHLQRHIQKHTEERSRIGKGSVLSQQEHDELTKIFEDFQLLIAEAISASNEVPKFMDPNHNYQTINDKLTQTNNVKSLINF